MKIIDLFRKSEIILLEDFRKRMLESKTPIGVRYHKWRIDRIIDRVKREHQQGLRTGKKNETLAHN